MIETLKRLRLPAARPHHLRLSMPANVVKCFDSAMALTDHHQRTARHRRRPKTPRARNLALSTNKIPYLGENFDPFLGKNSRIGIDPRVDEMTRRQIRNLLRRHRAQWQ